MTAIILVIILALAFALQFLTGSFPVMFFAFPLNVIIGLIWIICILWLWQNRKESALVRHMLSPFASLASITLLLLACIFIGFTGWRHVVHSWVFIFIVFYLQTTLAFVILRGWKKRLRFLLLHAGLLLSIASAFWGAPDSSTIRMKVYEGMPTSEAFTVDGNIVWLDHEVELQDFQMEEYDSGMPMDFSAGVLIDGKSVLLKVNHPYPITFTEQIYLSGYDTLAGPDSSYCILQIVKDPWKYGVLTGILMMLSGAFLLFLKGPGRKQNQ